MPSYEVQMRYANLLDSEYPNKRFLTSEATETTDKQCVVMNFESVPETYRYKRLTGYSLYVYGKPLRYDYSYPWQGPVYAHYSGHAYVHAFSAAYDEDAVTYKTMPTEFRYPSAYLYFDSGASSFLWDSANGDGDIAAALLRNGGRVKLYNLQANLTNASSNRPYMLAYYNDDNVSLNFLGLDPSSGYVARHNEQIFSWSTTLDGYCAGEVKGNTSKVQWRNGASGSVNTISGSSSPDYCTIPADTFPASDDIQWRAVLTLNTGETITSEWQSISTRETQCSAECLSPKNVYLDATQTTEFSWRHIIRTGTEQTAWDIQTSLDGSQWTDLASGTGAETITTVAANTFEAGTLYWRVRTYNTDDAASEWSGPAQVTVIDAPDAPAVRVDRTTPRAQISWQSTGQEGYEIELDGESLGVFFGTGTSYLLDDFLADGGHVVRVRIQNKYAYWSEWGSAGFTVTNAAGEAITLDGVGGNVATLTWSTDGEFARYIIYRDGVPIGKTTDTSWTDNLMTEDATYYVRGIAAEDGNYTQSNNANLQYLATANRIAAVEDWAWVELSLSTTDTPTTSITTARQYASTNYTGHKYPVPELSEFYSKSISVSTAFPLGSAEAKAFEGLIGRVVCYKSISGDSVVGVLGNISKARNPFYVAYTCTISQIDWEEAVSVDP